MKRWQVPLQKLDFKKWWYAYIAHGLMGFICSAGTLTFALGLTWFGAEFPQVPLAIVAFAPVTFYCFFRQTVEFMRRNDTPGRDMEHHLIGYVVGLLLSMMNHQLEGIG